MQAEVLGMAPCDEFLRRADCWEEDHGERALDAWRRAGDAWFIEQVLLEFKEYATEVDIEWQLRHVPRGDRVSDGIDGDNAPLDSVDDPSVFDFSDVTAHMTGPSLPLKSAAACVPKDFNRLVDSLFSQTVTALTWKPGGGDHDEAVTSLDAALRAEARANPRVPLPVTVTFKPKRDVKYCLSLIHI